ncbi:MULTISPECIES: bifunctional helix-turn-helix transcriptional regulator/GNAT family N-acetyltransferase [Clostridium]|nr:MULTISPECIES: helix-turn-helix domain-containing GNAT family N-acetyltransferase [Clostridium]ADK13165.1 putative DNA-binding protein with a predicted acetyltransferase domain [Clostridium ljungdahlii DSM 13528]AGY76389.2 helix-turn-helix domain-containing GNAT family N-acetyltransferase [Clostridium autoethanogenum DSM 10061]
MKHRNLNIISEVRNFSRFYTNILGLLNQDILDSSYSLTEARILFEINKTKECTANILIDKLDIDKGYLSRILNRFKSDELIIKEKCSSDGRLNFLKLTENGKNILSSLSKKSDNQISKLTDHLDENEKENLVNSMRYIIKSLSYSKEVFNIRTYRVSDIEYIIEKHRELYKNEFGFSNIFGDYVEKYLIEFHRKYNSDLENIWIAEQNNKPVGVIAIAADKTDPSLAQLRWFLVEPNMRNSGLGHILLDTAINFCKDKNYKHIFLWTADVLKTARYLYGNYGFKLTESMDNTTWTNHLVKEERWDLYI